MMLSLILSALCLLPAADLGPSPTSEVRDDSAHHELIVYPPLPGNLFLSDRYEVKVVQDGVSRSSYVYRDPNNDPRWRAQWPSDEALMTLENHFTSFSFFGHVVVQIKLPSRKAISSAVVRPLSKNLSAAISGNSIYISLTEPANLFVEIDGEKRYPLFIFANPLEEHVPSPCDPNVVYFGPGVHDVGVRGGTAQSIPVGKTVYLAGGAYVKGVLTITGGTGTTTIRGRGILSGIGIPGLSAYRGMIVAGRGSLIVEGITILDSPQGYQGIIAFGDSSVVQNVKMLSWAMESDSGVLGDRSRITNCFFKINDDVLKPIRKGMLFTDNVVWQQMCGAVIMLGWNSTNQGIDATISGLDVIGCDRGAKTKPDVTTQSIVSLVNSNGAPYTGVMIENVRLETRPYLLFSLDIKQNTHGWVNDSRYNKGIGSVDGLVFRNISMPQSPVRISSFNGNGNVTPESSGDIKTVTFENVRIGGIRLNEQNAGHYLLRSGITSNFVYR